MNSFLALLFRYATPRLLLLAPLFLPITALATLTLYVSPAGNDLWSGRSAIPQPPDGPFATLDRARTAVRDLKAKSGIPAGGVVIEISGILYLRQPFALQEQDSGSPGRPVIYKSTSGAVISGGRVVTNFRPVSDPQALARLGSAAKNHVLAANLKELGITDFGDATTYEKHMELSFGGRMMQVARWPNSGFVRIGKLLGSEPIDIRGVRGNKEPIFTYDGDRPSRWIAESDAWLDGYWFWDWHESRQKIAAIDTERKAITLNPPFDPYGYRAGQWYYAFNMLSELDTPGEYYLDRSSGFLYFWPPSIGESGKNRAVVSMTSELINLNNVAYVRFDGLTLEGSRGTALVVNHGANVDISTCVVRNVGGWAIRAQASTSVRVHGCDIYGTGGGGIFLAGGERATLEPAHNLADENHIHDFGRWIRTYQPAIALEGVGNSAAHNLIDSAPHTAILFNGNDHVIEFNEIHHVCQETLDVGAIYAGRDWTMRGNVIRHNYLHDLNGLDNKGCVGVYLDDQFSSATILGNIFYNVTTGVEIGGGRDNIVENNIFFNVFSGIAVDARGLNWAAGARKVLTQRLESVPYNSPTWRQRYPALAAMVPDREMEPTGNRLIRNITANGNAIRFGDPLSQSFFVPKDSFEASDHDFVDTAHGDFHLRADAAPLRLGFQPLPLSEIGRTKSLQQISH